MIPSLSCTVLSRCCYKLHRRNPHDAGDESPPQAVFAFKAQSSYVNLRLEDRAVTTDPYSFVTLSHPVVCPHDRPDLHDLALREVLEDWPVLVGGAVHVVAVFAALVNLKFVVSTSRAWWETQSPGTCAIPWNSIYSGVSDNLTEGEADLDARPPILRREIDGVAFGSWAIRTYRSRVTADSVTDGNPLRFQVVTVGSHLAWHKEQG